MLWDYDYDYDFSSFSWFFSIRIKDEDFQKYCLLTISTQYNILKLVMHTNIYIYFKNAHRALRFS